MFLVVMHASEVCRGLVHVDNLKGVLVQDVDQQLVPDEEAQYGRQTSHKE